MARRNWMPLYISDFITDTRHLTATQTGAYLCLIMEYWVKGGLPDDDAKLAKLCRVHPHTWKTNKSTLQAFFHDGWKHKRIDRELAKMVEISASRSAVASKGGAAASLKRAQLEARLKSASSTNEKVLEVHYTTQERKITSSFTGTAREGTKVPPVDNSQVPPASVVAGLPAGFAEKARVAVQQASGSLGSGELTAVLQAKGWVPK